MSRAKIPDEWDLGASRRYKKKNMERAMRGKIERGLVELITNSDDSYRNLEERGEKVSGKIKEILAESSGDVVIEGHYAVDVVVPEKVKFVFVLRRDPVELRKVLTERGYREGKIRENLAAEILDVCMYDAVNRCGRDKVCEVDVTGKKVDDVMKEIFQILDGKKPCSIGIVDWLSRLESAGKLDEYLAEF